jgi:hypothetical protein
MTALRFGRPALPVLLALSAAAAPAADSQYFGSVSNGRIEGSVALPTGGPNFSPYSRLAVSLGRTHVHSRVTEIVTDAYAELARQTPEVRYVYGETGWPSGGRFKPHRSHQNGRSVDFFVPVRNGRGDSVPLPPTSVTASAMTSSSTPTPAGATTASTSPRWRSTSTSCTGRPRNAGWASRRSSSTASTCRGCSPRRAAPGCNSMWSS